MDSFRLEAVDVGDVFERQRDAFQRHPARASLSNHSADSTLTDRVAVVGHVLVLIRSVGAQRVRFRLCLCVQLGRSRREQHKQSAQFLKIDKSYCNIPNEIDPMLELTIENMVIRLGENLSNTDYNVLTWFLLYPTIRSFKAGLR